MGNQSRREFLRRAGTAISGAGALRHFPVVAALGTAAEGASGQANPPSAPQRIRGVMVDAARLPESVDYYRRVIEFCAEWELNALQFRLTDDQGSALRFATVPNLITHPDALTVDELKGLVAFGKSHGVDLIPEIESFGHTGFITRSPQYAHLLDADPHGSAEFTGVIPVLAETRELFEKLYREVAAIFPSKYIHAGCDEVNWGGSSESRKALEAKTRPQVWAEYLNGLHGAAEGLGKQLIVWGDFVLHKEPQILSQLNKNVIIMDWNYWDTSAVGFHDALVAIEKSGHRGIGAPGLISYRWGPRPGSEQLRNIDAFAEAYFAPGDSNSLGAVLTNWVPTRYVQNSLWDGLAYGAVAFKDGPARARLSAFRLFVERHYRAEWNETWAEAFDLIYDAAPGYGSRAALSPLGLRLSTPWSTEAELKALVKDGTVHAHPFARLRSLLVQLEPAVLRNLSDFHAFALSVDCLEMRFWRDDVVLARVAHKPFDPEAAKLAMQTIAERDRDLVERLSADWDKGRRADSAAKKGLIFGLQPKDQLLYQWRQAADYSAALALHADRFQQLLTEANP